MLFWHIFSDVKNEYAPGEACWPPAGGPGETVLLEEDKGRDRNTRATGSQTQEITFYFLEKDFKALGQSVPI